MGSITLKCTVITTMMASRIEGANDFCLVSMKDRKQLITKLFNNVPRLATFFEVGGVYTIHNGVVGLWGENKVSLLLMCVLCFMLI